MASERDLLSVHLDAEELGPAGAVATLAREGAGGREVISFAYESRWVGTPRGFPLDPSLALFEGEQYTQALPGILADAAPDRWGRTLLERREGQRARQEDRRPRQLGEWDFLVGVDDQTRMGALRLTPVGGGPFLSDERQPVPPLARLRELEHWARQAEEGLSDELEEDERWLSMLVAPGSSLGGARPKASYVDEDGLWIAKFPSHEDRHDVGAWEYVVSRLAGAAGVEVPETRLLSLGSAYRTFCTRRFDRVGDRRRLYASAMTLTGRRDHEEASYLDIAKAIVDLGDPAAIEFDLHQLFRRVAFNVMTANRDDHLRNHGFLRTAHGWRLTPAFDVNPSPRKMEHSLALNESLRLPDLNLVIETAPYYRLSGGQAEEIVAEIRTAVAGWPELAREARLPAEELERIGAAFEVGSYNP
jgi:serine/threonine-protein kinase HipA